MKLFEIADPEWNSWVKMSLPSDEVPEGKEDLLEKWHSDRARKLQRMHNPIERAAFKKESLETLEQIAANPVYGAITLLRNTIKYWKTI